MESSIENSYTRAQEAADAIRSAAGIQPRIGIVLGSGLGQVVEGVEGTAIPYSRIPHFPVPTAPGHAGKLIIGELKGASVVVMSGRVHLYEGYTADQVALPIRVMAALGVETLILTNAAGAVNLAFTPGNLMLISDHINLTGHNPLVGAHHPCLSDQFPDMSEAYDRRLRGLAHDVARSVGVALVEGVYMGLMGPSFETPTEIRMARMLGADAVGMSTVVETIAARGCGIRVLGISCITNMAAGILPIKLSGEEVYKTAREAQPRLAALLYGLLEGCAAET